MPTDPPTMRDVLAGLPLTETPPSQGETVGRLADQVLSMNHMDSVGIMRELLRSTLRQELLLMDIRDLLAGAAEAQPTAPTSRRKAS